jgi:hypothetical protein
MFLEERTELTMQAKFKEKDTSPRMFSFKLPKSLSKEFASGSIIEGRVEGGQLFIKRPKKVREGWEESFRLMHERGDDALMDFSSHTTSSWDKAEWQW